MMTIYLLQGNLPSLSEMCIAFLTVYPAPDMSECYSLPGWAVDAKLGYELVANRFKYDKPVPRKSNCDC